MGVMVSSHEREGDPYVLVVEDDEDLRRALLEILELEGYRTVSATNGVEALELIRAAPLPPSLILLDIVMPEMNGWDFLLCIDKDPSLQLIPVALTSSHPSVSRSLSKYCDNPRASRLLFPKPLSLLRLLSTVQHFCVGPGASGDTVLADESFSPLEAPTAKLRALPS